MSIDSSLNFEVKSIEISKTPLPHEIIFGKELGQEDMALLEHQWDVFNQIKQFPIFENPIQKRRLEGGVDLTQGTLLHGTSFNIEKIKKIKETGIVSGELIGIPEDNETHYCADFFRVPNDTSIPQYLEWCGQPIINGMLKIKRGESAYLPRQGKQSKQIAFIINNEDSRLQPLLKYDAYGPSSHERMKSIINFLPREFDPSPTRTTSAILIGIPSNFISGIIISDGISTGEAADIKQIMGEMTSVFRTNGEII